MSDRARSGSRAKVVIAGGGVAALEAALALHDLGGTDADVEIHSPRSEFLYRPYSVGEPFGAARVARYDLDRLAVQAGADFHLGSIGSVDVERRTARTRDGEEIPFDYLLATPGARPLWAVPGAATFWGSTDEGGVGTVIRRLRAGRLRRVVFTMPAGPSWTLPLYELALMSAEVLARSGVGDASLVLVTPEDAPLQVFGRSVAEQVTLLLEERGIELRAGEHPVEFDGQRLSVAPGEPVRAEAAISLPRLEGRRLEGLPHDERGFLPVDAHCAVRGLEGVFAAGDVTDFPVKQGGIATQQADAAASAIAADLGAEVDPAPFEPVLRGVLWTGAAPRYLHGPLQGGKGEVSAAEPAASWAGPEDKIVGRYLGELLRVPA